MSDKISYEDVRQYHHLFTMAPSFVLDMMAATNSNLVLKFKSTVQSYMNKLTDEERSKLNIILTSDIDDLQAIMDEAYRKTRKKQYRTLANPKNKNFIEKNLNELRKMI